MVQISPLNTQLSNDNQCYYSKDPDCVSLGSLQHSMVDTAFPPPLSNASSRLTSFLQCPHYQDFRVKLELCPPHLSCPQATISLVCVLGSFSYKLKVTARPPHMVEVGKLIQVKYLNQCLAGSVDTMVIWTHCCNYSCHLPVTVSGSTDCPSYSCSKT